MSDWRNRIVGTDVVNPKTLVPNEKNFRRHPNRQVAALEGSLDEIGWIAPVTVNRLTGRMLDGHARAELALRQGVSQVPVQYVELDEHEEALALATLDPIGAMATHDAGALDALLNEVNTGSAALQELLTEVAMDAGLYQPPAIIEDEAPVDQADELRAKWGVESGQMWALGDHRIICGDCTDAEVVARVMGGEKAALAPVDPPYNVGFDYDGKTVDDSKAVEAYEQFSRAWFGVCQSVSVKQIVTPGCNNLAHWMGTTIIACEQLGRKCRAVEISPAYVAVAIERWATLTGCEPQLVT
jgi:hypothetical protein